VLTNVFRCVSLWVLLSTLINTASATPESAVNPTAFSLPKGPGSITGLGEAFTPALNSGTSQSQISVWVPAGRNGMVPELVIEYNSGFGNGLLGVGRRLSIPFIQRQTDQGLPNYSEWLRPDLQDNDNDGLIDEFDEFDTFVDHNGDELVLVENTIYRSKNSSSFARYERLSDGWLVTQANGRKYYFGQTAQAQVAQEQQVFRWHLEAEEDIQGNRIEYHYQLLDNSRQIYLREITYNPSSLGAMSVGFVYEPRPDILTQHRAGFEIKTAFRLKHITTKSGERLLKTVGFEYEEATDWQSQSLLSKVSESAGEITLPPAVFTYTHYQPDALTRGNIPSARPIPFDNANIDFIDMNSDGLPDIINTWPTQDSYWMNQGPDADGVVQMGGYQKMNTYSTAYLSQSGVRWADIDGDGKVDMLIYANNRTSYFTLDADNDWQYAGEISGVRLRLDSPVVALVDINHDKRIDLLQTNISGNGPVLSHTVQLNLPEGWGAPTNLPMPTNSLGVRLGDAGVRLADMNGDGLPDLVSIVSERLVYFPNRGLRGFGDEVVFNNTPDTLYQIEQARLADMNNDGRSDLVYLNGEHTEIWLNLGPDRQNHGQARFSEKNTIKPAHSLSQQQVRLVDINGNGSTDIVWYSPGELDDTYYYAELFPVEQPHQLKSFSNGIGSTTTLFYGSLADEMIRDRQAGNVWEHNVPVTMQVLKRIEVDDGIGGPVQVTQFDYHNGFYHSQEKEFRGFADSEETRVGDVTAPSLITAYQFHIGQDQEVLKGRPKQTTTQDTHGKIFWQETLDWQVRELLPGFNDEPRSILFAAQVEREKTWIEQGRGNPVTLRWSYDYDDYGNTTRIEESGRTDGDWNDERITFLRFSAESTSGRDHWVLNLPIERKVTSLLGSVVAKEQWFYDDESFTGDNLGELSKGNLTLRKTWYEPATEDATIAAERYRYDSHGNRIASFGPLWGLQPGHQTTIRYDANYHTFPEQEQIYTGNRTLTASAGYDYGLAVITDYSDFNQAMTRYVYDSLGRLTAIAKPGDSDESPTLQYSRHLAQSVEGGVINWVDTHQRESVDGGTVDSRTYYDGLGRTMMVRSEGEEAGQVVVSGQQQFNVRGERYKDFSPYFSQGLDYQHSEFGDAYRERHYDALGRSHIIYEPYTQADNTTAFTRTTYYPLSQVIEDAEQTATTSQHAGASKQLIYDGLLDKNGVGRLRRVDERVGLDRQGESAPITTWSTYYDYDLNGHFTRLQDAQGNVRAMSYDALGRNYFVDDPDRGHFWQSFDAAGNVIATRDARGWERHYQFDGVNRPLNEYHLAATASPESTVPEPGEVWQPQVDLSESVPVVSYQYDTLNGSSDQNLLGRLAKVEDQAGFIQWGYDYRGRVQQRQRKIEGDGINSALNTINIQYDSADRMTRYQYADGTSVNYVYNARGLLEHIPQVVDSIGYNPAGKMLSRTLANGVNTLWQFDERLRLAALNSTRINDAVRLQQADYQFDAVSNLLSIQDGRSQVSLEKIATELQLEVNSASDLRQNFSYLHDDLYRLTQASSGFNLHQYRYDPTGNIVKQATVGLLGLTDSTTLRYGNSSDDRNNNAWNRIGRQVTDPPGPHALTWMGRSLTYDANGNRTQEDGQSYQWDHHNRLVTATTAQDTSLYGYDYQHKRRYKITENSAGDRREVLYLDDSSEVRDGQLIKYVMLDGRRLARSSQDGGEFIASEFYLHQHLGSTAYTLSRQGVVLNAFTYKPYGDLERQYGQFSLTHYRYTGQEQDEETGLSYHHRRYMQTTNGRFLTPDPVFAITERFIDPQRWSPYAYARNNPVNYVDPMGESAESGTSTLDTSKFSIDMQKGPVTHNGMSAGPHAYSFLEQICTYSSSQCTTQAFEKYWGLAYAAPGQTRLAGNGVSNLLPAFGLKGPNINYVSHELQFYDRPGGMDGLFMRTANVTDVEKHFHIFDGRVDRYYYKTQFGINVLTVGAGGKYDGPPLNLMNNIGGVWLFQTLNETMRNDIQITSDWPFDINVKDLLNVDQR
jgi:RHS repeat-associated protein